MCYGCRFIDRESGDCTRSKCINEEIEEEKWFNEHDENDED